MKSHSVFFVSDRTGKTAESIGFSLLSQFGKARFKYKTYSFVTNQDDAKQIVEDIARITEQSGVAPIVISTIVDAAVEEIIANTDACLISLFNEFIEPLEKHLKITSSHSSGLPHEEFDNRQYKKHIEAIEFTMRNDDGKLTTQFQEADIILIGVSRCAKTPTCLYLAMNYSIKAANYPLTDDDLTQACLPDSLLGYQDKIVGLTIRADKLSTIRQQRRPNSCYASLEQCKKEINQSEKIMAQSSLTIFDSTSISVEEIAVKIAKEKNLLKRID